MNEIENVSIDKMMWKWLSVHDDRRCGDCADLTDEGPWLYEDLPTLPGAGDTECGSRCRCTLGPELSFELYGRIAGDSILNITRDTGTFFTDFDEKRYTEISDLVREYENVSSEFYETGDWNLPDIFYTKKFGFSERKKYLEGLIERVKSGTLTNEDIASISKRNSDVFANGVPERK